MLEGYKGRKQGGLPASPKESGVLRTGVASPLFMWWALLGKVLYSGNQRLYFIESREMVLIVSVEAGYVI
jgi:hypothetical protein